MPKKYICKSKFHDCYRFLDIYENLKKTLLTLPVPNILKQLIETKNDINFYYHTSLWCLGIVL